MFSKSQNYKKVNYSRLSYRKKKKFFNIHIPVLQFWFTQYTQCTAIYCPMQYIDMGKCIELYCTTSYCNTATY